MTFIASATESIQSHGFFVTFLLFAYALILLVFPIWVIVRLDGIHKATLIHNKLMRQLLKAYGHKPEA